MDVVNPNAPTTVGASSNVPEVPVSQPVDPNSNPQREQIADSIFREITDDRIHIYTLATERWEPINRWLEIVVQTLEQCPTDQSCRLVYDFSRIRIYRLQIGLRLNMGTGEFPPYDMTTLGITPDINNRMKQILSASSKFKPKLAVVLSMNLSARATRIKSHTTNITAQGWAKG